MNLLRKLVVKNLKLNKKRTIVTIVGIILSVALLSALSTLIMSFRESVIQFEIDKGGNYHVYYDAKDLDFCKQIENNIYIENTYYFYGMGYAKIDGVKNEDKPYIFVIGTDKNGLKNGCSKLVEGRLPENENEIVLARHLKTNGRVDIKVGDTISLNLGKRVNVSDGSEIDFGTSYLYKEEMLVETHEKQYKVVGIIERPSSGIESYSDPGYSAFTYCESRPENATYYHVFARYTTKGLSKYPEVTANILGADPALFTKVIDSSKDVTYEEYLEFCEVVASKPGFSLNQYLIMYERMWPVDDTFKIILILGIIVAVIIIVTSVYCIKNSFEISVTEKIRQYGMLAGIGATKKQIRKSVHEEAGIMGLIGIPLGVASGIFAAWVLLIITNKLIGTMSLVGSINFVFRFSIIAVAASVILGIVTIYLSAAKGAHKAAKVSPIEAIRNQNEIKINSKKIKAPFYVSKLWGIGGVISYKNIKRNRRKYRTTVVSIAICTITFIIVYYFMSLGKSLVSVQVTDDEANITVSISNSLSETEILKDIKTFDKYEKVAYILSDSLYVSADYVTKDCKDYFYPDGNNLISLSIVGIDSESLNAYAKEVGIKLEPGKGILVNSYVNHDVGKLDVFNLAKGDSINFITYRYTDERDENDDRVREKIEFPLEICGVSDTQPFGRQWSGSPVFIMSITDYNELLDKQYTSAPAQTLYFKTSSADALQDDLERFYEANEEKYGDRFYINNRDKNIRDEQTIFTLVGIFSYGLIVVIALIGVTNIVNTISTSMELRAREFATLRSVGMTSGEFGRMVRLESLFTSAKSLFFGLLIGCAGSYGIWYLENNYDMKIKYQFPLNAVIISIVVVIVLVYTIISVSLSRINKRNIIDTIKNENL